MFIFRTPNVLAFPVYAAALWKIGGTFNSLSKWGFCLGLLLCYPLFEYFGLARGYALSFACIVFAFSFLIQFWKRGDIEYSIYAAICVILSISANLALIHFGITFSLILMAILLDRKKLKSWSILAPLAIILAGLSFASIGFNHKRIIQVYFEHSDGFIHSTMKTVVNMLTYSIGHPLTLWVIITPFLGAFLVNSLDVVRHRTLRNPVYWMALTLFITCVIASYLLSWLFEIHFPTDRVGLYFIPLYFLTVFSGTIILKYTSATASIIGSAIAVVPALFVIAAFVNNFNLNQSNVEPYAHLPEETYLNVARTADTMAVEGPPIVSADMRLSYAWRYYCFKHNLGLNPSVKIQDLYAEIEIIENGMNKRIQKRNKLDATKLSVNPKEKSSKEFVGVHKSNYSSLDPKKVFILFKLFGQKGSRSVTYCSLKNQRGDDIVYTGFNNDHLLMSDSSILEYSWFLPPCDSCVLNVYIHNVDGSSLTIDTNRNRTRYY